MNKTDRLYEFMERHKGKDVDIIDMWNALRPDATVPLCSYTRYTQVYVGAFVARINKKITPTGHRVIPGRLKRTYRLIDISNLNEQ